MHACRRRDGVLDFRMLMTLSLGIDPTPENWTI
jgi:hypothetical protein